jgi:hypothetical protein
MTWDGCSGTVPNDYSTVDQMKLGDWNCRKGPFFFSLPLITRNYLLREKKKKKRKLI